MPVSIPDLNKAGVSSGAYKGHFTAPYNKKKPLIKKLEQTLSDRFSDVRTRNLSDYRTYWGIDLLHETPFLQTTQTMIHALLAKKLDAKAMESELAAYGLSENDLFLKVNVPGVGTKLVPNAPLFQQVLIGVTIAYHGVRTAGIYGERDTSPQFKFQPLQQSDRNRVACEIWTDIVDTIATWYGYSAYKKQAIAQALKYGVMLAFPMEEWHYEEQIIDGKKVVQKEGLRYVMPDPTHMGWDLNHPLPTINTDSGCEYVLHWDVIRYGDILDNRKYWNRRAITHSRTNWFDPVISQNYFNEVYPCQLRFPATNTSGMSREDKAAFYGTAQRDNAVFRGTQFFKLIPKDWGLAEYSHPVWHRFDMANDDTVIWAAPCAYTPTWFIGYDWDSAAGQHSSLSLEISPWQRHLENILTTMYLTAKENLVNLIYYDRNLVDKSRIEEIKNLGEDRYRGMQFIDYDSLQLARGAALDARNAFHQINFQQRSIQELQSMMSTTLSIMERVLQFTAQETGSTAAHYQSAREVGITASNSNQRRNLTASGVDDGFEAWGRQLVTASKAYLNDDVIAQVSSDIPNYEQHVKDLGFEVKSIGDRKVIIAGKKSKLPLETFARNNIGPAQPNDPESAKAITSALSIAFQNEQVFTQIGPKRIIKLLEQAVILSGGPRNFDLSSEINGGDGDVPALMAKLAPVFAQLQQTILGQVQESLGKPVAEALSTEQQKVKELQAVTQQLQQIFQATGIEAERLKMQAAETQQDMQIKQMQAAAEEQRKTEAHQLDLQIKAQKAGVDTTIATQRTETDLALKESAAASDARNKMMVAAAKVDATEKTAGAQAEATKKSAAKEKPAETS